MRRISRTMLPVSECLWHPFANLNKVDMKRMSEFKGKEKADVSGEISDPSRMYAVSGSIGLRGRYVFLGHLVVIFGKALISARR